MASEHSLVPVAAGQVKCLRCLWKGPLKFLQANLCQPLPFLISNEPVLQQLPRNARVSLNGVRAHATHRLHVYRGLVVCTRCGAVGAHRFVRLAEPCESIPEQVRRLGASQGKANLDAISLHTLPKHVYCWPATSLLSRGVDLSEQ